MKILATRAFMVCTAFMVLPLGTAQAASLSLIFNGDNHIADDGAIVVRDGDLLSFTIFADFSGPGERTLGGGFDIHYDPDRLTVVNYVEDCGLNDFCRDALIDNGLIQDFGFGAFSGYTEFEGSQMTFRYLGGGAGVETFINTAESTTFAGPFVSAIDFMTILDVDYQGVVLREVPLPGAVWLLISGVAMLRAVRRA